MRFGGRGLAIAIAFTVVVGAGCKKKKKPFAMEFDAGPRQEAQADIEAKDMVSVIVASYPPACDADVATRAWGLCRESGSGYGAVYGCAEKSLRDARAALAGLRPSTKTHGACGDEIEKASVEMLNATPRFFVDLTRWLQENHDRLAPALARMSLGEVCRETPNLCKSEPHDYDDAYKALRMHRLDGIACTAQIFRCGQSQAMDCWLGSVAPRLGVACPGTPNRSGASPDDLLYVRETGTPIAR